MTLAVLLFAGIQLAAQTNVYVNLGAAIPVGDFAAGDEQSFALLTDDTEAGAGFGFTVGAKVKFGTKARGLGIIATLDGIYNGLNSDMKDYLEDLGDYYDSQFSKDFSLKTPKYFNLPVMVGANYTYAINNKMGIYGEAALGVNLRAITNLELEGKTDYYGSTYKVSETYNYNTAFSFAYQVGAGVNLTNKLCLGISFYSLGSSKVSGKHSVKETYDYNTENASEKFKFKRINPALVMLRLGYKF